MGAAMHHIVKRNAPGKCQSRDEKITPKWARQHKKEILQSVCAVF